MVKVSNGPDLVDELEQARLQLCVVHVLKVLEVGKHVRRVCQVLGCQAVEIVTHGRVASVEVLVAGLVVPASGVASP